MSSGYTPGQDRFGCEGKGVGVEGHIALTVYFWFLATLGFGELGAIALHTEMPVGFRASVNCTSVNASSISCSCVLHSTAVHPCIVSFAVPILWGGTPTL